MPILRIPAFSGNGRADSIEKHVWTTRTSQPLEPTHWLYICGPHGAAEQIRQVGGRRCVDRPDMPAAMAREYSHCFEFAGGQEPDVVDLVRVLEEVRILSPRSHVDHALVLDWYKVPDDDVDPMRWPNTPAGDLVNRGKYRGDMTKARELAGWMANIVGSHPLLCDATIVTVPGSRADGQSFGERLAVTIQRRTGNGLLVTQSAGARPERKTGGASSLLGTLSLPQTVQGSVLIIDDVVRSGHSLSAVGLAARQAGAESVFAFAAVKTMRDH